MKKIVFILISCLMISSCENESFIQNNNLNMNFDKLQKDRIFTNEQIKEIGILHNENLEIAFKNFNWQSKDNFHELKENFKKIEQFDSNKTIYSASESLNIIRRNLEVSENYFYFNSAINYLSSKDTDKNVTSIENYLESLEVEFQKNNSSNLDFETFLVFSSVLKSSSKFWLPESLGGLGKFDEYKNYENGNSNYKLDWRDCLKDVLAGDGASAGAGFIVGAGVIAASSGPVAPLVFIGAIAAEAGISSGYSYLTSDNC